MGNDGPSSIGGALDALMSGELSRGLTDAQRASRAWYQANGDFERRHTCGVFLKERAEQNLPPVLYVYIDSSSILQDFTTNRDIYRLRLENLGFVVDEVQFRLSRYKKQPRGGAEARSFSTGKRHDDLPPATPAEVAEATDATRDLPDGLRQTVCEAMISSLRRQRAQKDAAEKNARQNGSC